MLLLKEFKQLLPAHRERVLTCSTERTQQSRPFAVFRRSDPLEIGGAVVGDDTVEVIALVVQRTWANPCGDNENVAIDRSKIAHKGIEVPPLAVMALFARHVVSRREGVPNVGESTANEVVELAFGRAIEGLALGQIERAESHLGAILQHE